MVKSCNELVVTTTLKIISEESLQIQEKANVVPVH